MRIAWTVVLGAAGCAPHCDLERTATTLAGAGAAACGFVALGDPLADAWSCAVDAFTAGSPFWIAWENHGSDSLLTEGRVSDGTRVVDLHQDHFGAGPARIDGYDCLEPFVGEASDNAYDGIDEAGLTEVLCTGRAPPSNHYEVCGTCTGCNPPGLPFVWP